MEGADQVTAICSRVGCTTCRAIVVGLIAAELASVPEELRAGVVVDAIRKAKAVTVTAPEAARVEEQIG
jgi:hypothetical protein